MVIDVLRSLYRRDLEKLRTEIAAYSDEAAIWKIDGGVTNSAGNLCLHLIGNLNAYIGAELGGSGYVRHRDLEFSTMGTPRDELIRRVNETIDVVDAGLERVTPEKLDEDYPIVVFTDKMTTGFFLIHLATHLNYHLGQINYHRRLFDK